MRYVAGPLSKNRLSWRLFVVCCLLSARFAVAQNQIEGRLQPPSGVRLPENVGVTLRLEMGSMIGSEVASGSGRFSFTGLRPGKYLITVRADGFQRVEQAVEIPSGYIHQVVNVIVRLAPAEAKDQRRISDQERTIDVESLQVPKEAVRALAKAEEAAASNQLNTAIRYAREALEIYPNFFAALNNLAVYNYRNGDRQKAVGLFERALKINGQAAGVCLNLGRVYLELDEVEKGLSYLSRATELQPSSSEAFYYLGRAYIMLYQFRDAIEPLRKALDQEPAIAHSRFLLAHVLWELGRGEEAVRELEEYIRGSGGDRSKAQQTLASWKDQVSQ